MNELTIKSPLLTALEAVEFLRLDTDYEAPEDAVEALHRLVRKKKLRPVRCGRRYKFWEAELRRFIEAETEAFGREPTEQADDFGPHGSTGGLPCR